MTSKLRELFFISTSFSRTPDLKHLHFQRCTFLNHRPNSVFVYGATILQGGRDSDVRSPQFELLTLMLTLNFEKTQTQGWKLPAKLISFNNSPANNFQLSMTFSSLVEGIIRRSLRTEVQ